jgi:DNA-binding winged helix-turn-helix (wHTH) protein/TolB-like protein/Flp pilus assembly protein TadD
MTSSSGSRATLRFGNFALDLAAYELRRDGRSVKLGRQQMDLLILLVEHRRQLVSRSEIVNRLWGQDVFVDVETGVNTAISKIRQALRDSTDAPAFIETVPGKGYRFIADVSIVEAADATAVGVMPSPMSAPPIGDAVTGVAETRISERLPPAVATSTSERAHAEDRRAQARPSRLYSVIGLVAAATLASVLAWMWQAGGTRPPPRVSLVVLPIQNVGGDRERDHVAMGLTEETTASLAQIDPDRLIIKGRALHYRGTTKTAAEIGRELSVDYLLESTLRTEGNRLRMTTTLIRVRDQEHVWSQSYDREPTSLLELQRDLSTAIAEQIRVRLSSGEPRDGPGRQTGSSAAYDAYLKGRYLESRRTPSTVAQAIQEYKRAIELDPAYALAWSSLAVTYAASTVNSDARPLTAGPLARDAAARAVRANPRLAEAQFAVGYVDWLLDWDWPAADAAFRAAVRLDPGNAASYRSLGHALSQSGRHTEAEDMMRRNRELEPLEPMTFALSAQVAFQARRYTAAIEHARRAILINSAFWIGYAELAQAYEQTGEPELALEALRDAARFSGGNTKNASLSGYVLAKSGRRAEAEEVLRQLRSTALERYVPPTAFAIVYAGLGHREAAFEWLEKAVSERDVHLIFLPVDPKWDSYRSDPRFAALLARCRFTTTQPR